MARKWTPEERRKYLSAKFFTVREKIFVVALCIIFFSIIAYLTYSFYISENLTLFIIFLLITIVSIPVIIFAIDLVFYGAE